MKHLRIYLKQPSPTWLDFSLRSINAYTKRVDYSQQNASTPASSSTHQSTRLNSATGSSVSGAAGGGSFDAFRAKLRTNLQGVKKQTKNQAMSSMGDEDDAMNAFNTAKLVGSAIHHYTEDVRRLELGQGFI